MKINWKKEKDTVLTFTDLKVNEGFKISSYSAKGAVYIKVDLYAFIEDLENLYCITDNCFLRERLSDKHRYAMMEVATGKIFPPTKSVIAKVDLELNINDVKPALYDKSTF